LGFGGGGGGGVAGWGVGGGCLGETKKHPTQTKFGGAFFVFHPQNKNFPQHKNKKKCGVVGFGVGGGLGGGCLVGRGWGFLGGGCWGGFFGVWVWGVGGDPQNPKKKPFFSLLVILEGGGGVWGVG